MCFEEKKVQWRHQAHVYLTDTRRQLFLFLAARQRHLLDEFFTTLLELPNDYGDRLPDRLVVLLRATNTRGSCVLTPAEVKL